jgi:hypothetical protein
MHQFMGMVLKEEFVNLTEGTLSAVFPVHAGRNPVLEVQHIGGVHHGIFVSFEVVFFYVKINWFVVVCGLLYNRR